MPVPRVLFLADPAEPRFRLLHELPPPTDFHFATDPEAIAREAPGADILVHGGFGPKPFLTAWPLAKRVRWVHSLSAGVDSILTPDFRSSPVPLTNARGVFAESLAEYAMLAVLYFAKDVPRMIRDQQGRRWENMTVEMVKGRTVGIIGYGAIGRECGRLAVALGMRVIALRRRPHLADSDGIAERVYGPAELHDLLHASDYVVLCTPATRETKHMIGAQELRAMKDTAVLINLGRGNAIDEAALAQALRENWIRGAALDVVQQEPLPSEHPFYSLPNILISQHSADRTPDWLERATRFFMENYVRFVNNEPLANRVDKMAGY